MPDVCKLSNIEQKLILPSFHLALQPPTKILREKENGALRKTPVGFPRSYRIRMARAWGIEKFKC